jgi:hypothetical protein
LTIAAATLVAIAFGAGFADADPIIPNASFSLGYSGFTSSYTYLSSPTLPNDELMYPEGAFTVGANPSQVHSLWPNFGDHTTGDGSMMIVNGNRAADVMVWSATVLVTPDTHYDFSAWAASIYPESPSGLAFSINGSLLAAPFVQPSTTGLWRQFTSGWYSGTSTTATLSLVDWNTEWNGNDFALDDIALEARPPVVPEPASLLLFGSGLAALAGVRKNRKE